MIPKNIHIIWWQKFANLPEHLRPKVQSIVDKNPGWNIYFWDEESIRKVMSQYGPQYLAKLDEYKFLHQSVDLSRFFLLHQFGGVSVDTDVVALKGFDETPHLNDSSFIVSANSSSVFENWVKNGKPFALNNATILTTKGNPVMKGLMDHILELSCDVNADKEKCIQSTTGPREFTNYLLQYKDQITILKHSIFEPCGGSDAWGCTIPEDAILDHQHEGSWVSERNKNISRAWYWLKAHWLWIVGIIGLILLISKTRKVQTS